MAKLTRITDPDAQRIAVSYYRAKAANPKLTQREFARKTFPTITERWGDAKSHSEQRRIELSGARYLRLVLEGKRTGRVNVKRGTFVRGGGSPDLFQVFVPIEGGGWKSFDLGAVGARSTFDIPLVETRLREDMSALEAKRRAWAQRYALRDNEINIDSFEVRRVTRHRKHSVSISLRGLKRMPTEDEYGNVVR
jgi:hypothetical protein